MSSATSVLHLGRSSFEFIIEPLGIDFSAQYILTISLIGLSIAFWLVLFWILVVIIIKVSERRGIEWGKAVQKTKNQRGKN